MIQLHHGDCLDVLRTMPDASVDAIVTDPPYGLRFMGKKWDYDVPTVELWVECLRVLKPGGHLLAFAGTRTQHRMAVRIEDAGFEIRDMIAWVYGSGFPKSLDVSKAIDKMDAVEEQRARRFRFTAWVRSTGVTSRQIDEATGTNMGNHYTTAASQPAVMTREHLEMCRHLFSEVPEWVEQECDVRSVESRNFAAREVTGHYENAAPGQTWNANYGFKANLAPKERKDIPVTEAARQWAGWGTALKPALEPITMARKPLEGAVAANVLQWGTGGINVDGCRVGTDLITQHGRGDSANIAMSGRNYAEEAGRKWTGRWPANLIHSGEDEVVGLFPGAGKESAARFFYTAKADAIDRNDGLSPGERNAHPTVKPVDLMCYLCRLVTPPGGIVLDPFMGSGSTGKACVTEGFSFIGIERDADSFATAQARVVSPMPLFKDVL